MSKLQRTSGALLATSALALIGIGIVAQAQEPGKGVGVGVRIGEAVDRAGDSIKESFHKAKGSVQAMSVQARVYSRIHWDKSLADAEIDLDVTREGVATLKGAVANPVARNRAAELASTTVGVTSVVNDLAVRPVGSTTTTTIETTTTPRQP